MKNIFLLMIAISLPIFLSGCGPAVAIFEEAAIEEVAVRTIAEAAIEEAAVRTIAEAGSLETIGTGTRGLLLSGAEAEATELAEMQAGAAALARAPELPVGRFSRIPISTTAGRSPGVLEI